MYLRLHMYSKELSSSSLLTLSKPKKEKKTPDKPLNCTLRSLSMQSINGLARAPVFALLCFYAAILFHCFMRIFYVNAIFSLIVFIKILFVIWIDCNRRLKIEVCMSNTKFYENDLETVHKNKQQQRKKKHGNWQLIYNFSCLFYRSSSKVCDNRVACRAHFILLLIEISSWTVATKYEDE